MKLKILSILLRDKDNNVVFRFTPRSSQSKINIRFPSKVVDGVIKTKIVEHEIPFRKDQLGNHVVHMQFCFNKIVFSNRKLELETDLGDAFKDLSDMHITYSDNVVLDIGNGSCYGPSGLDPQIVVLIIIGSVVIGIPLFVGLFLLTLYLIDKGTKKKEDENSIKLVQDFC